ncbi:MAG: diguanylate cyclase [Cyanobacteria bacterium P01_A01_bin.105]
MIEAHRPIPISVSIGVACLDDHDDAQGHTLLRRADQNLLTAKVQGRNQVVLTR